MKKLDTKIILSTLWIIVMFNMAFADILALYIPGIHEEIASFSGDTPISHLMLIGAIIHQIPIFMIFLSRILEYKINRLLNIITGIITITYVIGGGSLMPHYIFIAIIEVACMLLIIWTAWKWKNKV